MDSKKIARGGVSVVETLAKYGIKGTGMVIRCGAEATGILTKEACNLASHFSGCSLGNNIGDFLMKKTNGLVKSATKTVEKGSIAAIKKLADHARNGLS